MKETELDNELVDDDRHEGDESQYDGVAVETTEYDHSLFEVDEIELREDSPEDA